ncbi:MAG: hypothetical protein EU532_04785 [Promethearchaeota archaeon]|nr:MAG: hypothetical protein EU532_04785 [Candidatus Lokiarchaeota archaeon]
MISDPEDKVNDLQQQKTAEFHKIILKLNEVLKALEAFSENYDKKFNVSKLAQYLNLSSNQTDEIIMLVLYFQELFKTVLNHHQLKKSIINHNIYFVLEKELNNIPLPQEFTINLSERKIFSDFIYTFKHIQRGKGFNLNEPNTELLKNLAELRKNHPYLFKQNGKNLIYPSEAGLKLGDLILSYNKSSKKLTTLGLESTKVIFKDNV